MALVVKAKKGDVIRIGNDINILVISNSAETLHISIQVPPSLRIQREIDMKKREEEK